MDLNTCLKNLVNDYSFYENDYDGIKAGFLTNDSSYKVNSAMESAASGGHIDIFEFMEKAGGTSLLSSVDASVENGQDEMTDYLLEKKGGILSVRAKLFFQMRNGVFSIEKNVRREYYRESYKYKHFPFIDHMRNIYKEAISDDFYYQVLRSGHPSSIEERMDILRSTTDEKFLEAALEGGYKPAITLLEERIKPDPLTRFMWAVRRGDLDEFDRLFSKEMVTGRSLLIMDNGLPKMIRRILPFIEKGNINIVYTLIWKNLFKILKEYIEGDSDDNILRYIGRCKITMNKQMAHYLYKKLPFMRKIEYFLTY